MAVSYISAETPAAITTPPGTISITVPSDAEAIIVAISGYRSDSGQGALIDEMNFDDTSGFSFTSVVRDTYSDTLGTQTDVYIITDEDTEWPGTGSQTIYVDNTGFSYGAVFSVFYVKGLDTSNPIGDTDVRPYTGGNWTSSLTGISVGDMTIGASSAEADNPDAAPTGSGQTNIASTVMTSSLSLCVGYEAGESAFEMEGTSLVPVAFVINTTGGTSIIPQASHHSNIILG